MLRLKQEGKIKAIGTSIHDRQRAGRLARDSEIDLFMIRYNAKHPGAEQDIFPYLEKRNPAVVAYTALAWGQLIRPLKKIEMLPWPGQRTGEIPPLTPEDFASSLGLAASAAEANVISTKQIVSFFMMSSFHSILLV